MRTEINLVDPGLYKQNPSILQDIAYLKHNLQALSNAGLKFNDFPENIKNNPLFITEYFSTIETNKKEYKYIPDILLKEQFFVSACLKKNPDIYLLADPSCHTEFAFKTIRSFFPGKYLKYANDFDLNNLDFCKEAVDVNLGNFQYMPEKFRENKDIILKGVSNGYFSGKYQQAEQVIKYVPENVLNDDRFVNLMLNKNIYVFEFLPEKYKKDIEIVRRVLYLDSKLFKSVDESLRNDKKFVDSLLYHGRNNRRTDFEHFDNRDILIELDESFFNRDFCNENHDAIRKMYTSMNKKTRSNLEIIRAIYLFDPKKDKQYDLYKMAFLNKIPNPDLVQEVREFMTSTPESHLYEIGPERIVKIVESFELRKALSQELSANSPTSKKMKL